MLDTYSKRPVDCSADELAAFEALVLKGGEVTAEGLPSRIQRAERLVFSKRGEALIGVAAVKKPSERYRADTAAKSRLRLPKEKWPFEFGWAFIEESARGKGLSHDLVACALQDLDVAIFATSRAENYAIQAALKHANFRQQGECYPSDRHAGWMVVFLRPKPS